MWWVFVAFRLILWRRTTWVTWFQSIITHRIRALKWTMRMRVPIWRRIRDWESLRMSIYFTEHRMLSGIVCEGKVRRIQLVCCFPRDRGCLRPYKFALQKHLMATSCAVSVFICLPSISTFIYIYAVRGNGVCHFYTNASVFEEVNRHLRFLYSLCIVGSFIKARFFNNFIRLFSATFKMD